MFGVFGIHAGSLQTVDLSRRLCLRTTWYVWCPSFEREDYGYICAGVVVVFVAAGSKNPRRTIETPQTLEARPHPTCWERVSFQEWECMSWTRRLSCQRYIYRHVSRILLAPEATNRNSALLGATYRPGYQWLLMPHNL